jgi:hypothetical protein
MTIASFLFRRRLELTLCAASVALHVLALSWAGPQLGQVGTPRAVAPVKIIVAHLLAAPAPLLPVPAQTARPPKARLRGDVAPRQQAGDAPKLSDIQSVQPAIVAAPAALRRYRVDLPPSSRIVLDVERTDADGTLWHGDAAMAWTLDGGNYRMTVQAGIALPAQRVELVLLESEGKVGAAGFAPVTMTEKRRGRAMTAIHFGDGRITFSASPAAVALLPGAQDKATVPLQLAAIARGDSGQLDGDIGMLVAEDRDAGVVRFAVLGQESIDTGLGRMTAWHLSRPPPVGSYGSRLDIWLAPGHGWYPVKIRNIEASGAITTQTVNKIELTNPGT